MKLTERVKIVWNIILKHLKCFKCIKNSLMYFWPNLWLVFRKNGRAFISRVDLHTPKMLIIQFHTTKIIIIQFHTSSVWRIYLPYNFHAVSKNNRKKINHFCAFWEQLNRLVTKKNYFKFFFEKNAYHTISIYDTQIFPSNFENLPHIFFVFFFKRKSEKKIFACKG